MLPSLPPTHPVLRSTRFGQPLTGVSPQVEEYWRKGYVALRTLFTPAEVAAWQAECDRLLGLDLVSPQNLRTPFRHNSGNQPERIDPVVDISPLFARLARDQRITGIISEIFADKPLLFKDKLIFKAPGTHGYTLHQDQAWWQISSADDILSVSIQIDGASAANGCIELFPGAHDRLLTPSGIRTNLRDEDMHLVDPATGEKMESQPGDVLIFHALTPHQSAQNLAQVSRRSFYLTYSAARSGDHYADQLKNYLGHQQEAYAQQYRDTPELLAHFR